jgi:hypothetical protein
MALSKGDLEEAVAALDYAADASISTSTSIWIKACADDLRTEVERLANGPFTLAEAVASGRPFRRKAWGTIDGSDHQFVRHGSTDGTFSYFWAVGASGENTSIEADDITATDYEIKPEEDQR